MISAPSPASKSPVYSARSSAISITLRPASMPGPAFPIISPGPAEIPACFSKTFSLQMNLGCWEKGKDNPARADAVNLRFPHHLPAPLRETIVPDLLGYRAKIGVIIPSTNTTMEPELHLMAPAGVTFHTARLYLAQSSVRSAEEAQKAAAAFEGALE